MMNTVLLDKAKYDRNRFNCGIEALNNYLKVMASQKAKKDNTRTFVLEDDNDNSHVIGFYTLTMTPIDLKALPDKLQKKHQPSNNKTQICTRYPQNPHGFANNTAGRCAFRKHKIVM